MQQSILLRSASVLLAIFLGFALCKEIRLTGHQIPDLYRLHFEIFNSHSLNGTVSIEFLNKLPTDAITLHAVDLSFSHVAVERFGDSSLVDVTGVQESDQVEDAVSIFVRPPLLVNHKYILNISYSTKLCGRRYVLCPNITADSASNTSSSQMSVTTLTAPLGARTIFPCFDEPAYKALFEVSISHANDTMALSNAAISSKTIASNGVTTTTFDKTPILATYLVTIAVGHFTGICNFNTTKHGVQLCIYSSPANNVSMDILNKSLDTYTYYLTKLTDQFQIPYLMPKLDILVPYTDMEVGAMENPGLIQHHKCCLEGKQLTAHELSHQWFGNRVTIDWWCDIFIQEGISEYFGYQIQDDKSTNKMALLSVNYWIKNERPDTLKSLKCPVEDSSNITYIKNMWFTSQDVIYYKSVGVANMIADFLGEKNFIRSLIGYARRYDGKSVALRHLLDHLKSEFGRQLIESFEEWFTLPGFPEIHIIAQDNRPRHICQLKGNSSSHANGTSMDLKDFESQDGPLWQIPLVFITSANGTPSDVVWLRRRCMRFPSNVITEDSKWYFINPGMTYPYKINYDLKNWNNLLAMDSDVPKEINLQLIMDQKYFNPAVSNDVTAAFKAAYGISVIDSIKKYRNINLNSKKLLETVSETEQ